MTGTVARVAMIEAAERLFVENGVGAVSLREVQRAAGQRNKSAAHYHFGNRDGLISAIIDIRMGPVNARRRELLDDIDERPAVATMRDLVEALVQPLAAETLGRPGSRYARFLVQVQSDPAFRALVDNHLQADSLQDVRRRIVRRLDHLPSRLADDRVMRLIAMVVAMFAVWEGDADDDVDTARIADLVDSGVGLLEAPTSVVSREALTDRVNLAAETDPTDITD